MIKIHAKSSCCHAVVYRFGQRRRQCSVCYRTWSIRLKRRGRKRIRVQPNLFQFAGPFQESLRHKAKRLHKGREAIRRRHSANMMQLMKKSSPQLPDGPYIAIIDGFVVFFNHLPWTVYLILLRPISDSKAYVMPPFVAAGAETIRGWEQAFQNLPTAVVSQIQAVVTDGTLGMDRYARANGWVLQRCHCHILRMLYPLLGLRHKTTGKKRFRLTAFVKTILTTSNELYVQRCLAQLRHFAYASDCPKRFGVKLRGFLHAYRDFRSYQTYPKLKLPTTTNSVERVCGVLSELVKRTRSFRNPQAYQRWVFLILKLIPTIQCNGTIFNRKNVS